MRKNARFSTKVINVTNPHLVDRRGVSTDAARRQKYYNPFLEYE